MHLITTTNGQPTTTSLVIAEKFGKRHDHVLRAIDNLECSPEFRRLNFGETSNIVSMPKGGTRLERCFNVTRDGFSFLAMGFTGKEAAKWKEKFIGAFNAMERALRQQTAHQNAIEWQQARHSGKVVRLSFTDNVQEFVAYAHRQGSQNASKYYMQLTKMEYAAIFMVDKAVGDGFRDRLNAAQLVNLGTAELIAQRALREGMEAGLFYKDIYKLAKHKVEQFAGLIGKSLPGERFLRIKNAA